MSLRYNFRKTSLFYSFSEPCKNALGMQNRHIPNYAITASSMWDRNHGPYLGRLHFTARGHYQGGWSARHNNRYQWFQVDFRKPTKVTSVLTQGRQNANQWVTQYRLAYSQDGLTWAFYKLRDAFKVRCTSGKMWSVNLSKVAFSRTQNTLNNKLTS